MKSKYKIIVITIPIAVILIFTATWMEYGAVCNRLVLDHLHKYSNLFDENFNGEYAIENIGLPFGVTQMSLDECVDFIQERTLKESENEN